ncbi:Trk system potassium uptake protein TrkG [Pseudoruegeria aquimaris]|uniref:Trk system potassium uptake protein TrkG n=1 Tax=Pseudoruegeria aquimaris TaxID=393663 RepID=A0A1Y5RIJ7_9RHOB|nr:potassium transporter TrkG [Pseudoruegeria aquimaris]SLN18384.1 Trk system potassium uptake protein TrkG [Pseudoruegeria aquimaris]
MVARLLSLPLFVILMGAGALAMLLPALHAYIESDMETARVFLLSGVIFLLLTLFVAVATADYSPASTALSHMIALVAAFTILPAMLAVPFMEAVPGADFGDGYFEMVSALTTTGATLYDDPGSLPRAVHYWRALVGWLGGFLMWVAAFAILAPLSLGGFEVTSTSEAGQRARGEFSFIQVAGPGDRLIKYAGRLFPVYTGLTVLLWLGLTISGENAFVALCHAMSTLATSGISPVGGLSGGTAGIGGEVLVFFFMFFAISHLTFAPDQSRRRLNAFLNDPEFRFALVIITVVPLLLFLRHWTGALEQSPVSAPLTALRAAWGSLFTVLSFLTTTGFESVSWADSAAWSGLQTPGLILIGLCLVGGGVATTAGGVKLMRVYALYIHSRRELDRLVHPSSVGNLGVQARRIRRQGAYVSWVFFMLFTLSVAAIMSALALTGLSFESSLVLTVSTLSTTGPLADIGGEFAVKFAFLDDWTRGILIISMVLGRLETLAFIALLNPALWRR